MYDIRQFRFTLYALILIGFAAFGMAAESPGVWLLGTAAVLLNAWLVRTGRFVPMPRLLANVVTIGCMLYIAREVLTSPTPPVIVIGQFLVLLQLVKLWEQRANRDFAQLLVLSLLLVVAASINTASLWFALLLIGYLFLSLYCCLLFHLKVETDTAKAAFPLPDARINPATLRRDQRHLSRSMRRLTGFVAAVSVAMAVFVFLLFPRGGTNVFAGMQFRGQTLSGFSDTVQFEQVARITQNDRIVAHVQVWHNDVPVRGDRQLLLRGVTLDTYNSDPNSRTLARWSRTSRPDDYRPLDRSAEWQIVRGEHPEVWRQRVHLLPTGTNVLFALPGPVSFTPLNRDAKVRYTRDDGVLQLAEPIQQPIQYDVVSTDELGDGPEAESGPTAAGARPGVPRALLNNRRRLRSGAGAPPEAPPRTPANEIDPRIRAYAQRKEVCGTDEQGRSLGTLRLNAPPGPAARALDERIAQNFESHLQKDFTYTLDLTDTPRKPGVDPMVAFLTDFKKGHCEYFAGAMALMCQSLGMDARVVVGFKTDEFNDFSDQYVVRQSHAHAWVEVLTATGWQTFDPTSGRDPREQQGAASLAKKLKHFLDYLQFTYANSVIAYDNDQRENMLQEAENRMFNTAVRGDLFLGRLRSSLAGLLGNPSFWNLSSWLLAALLVVAIGGSVGLVGWFIWERWRLRRRAARIGLDGLDPDDRDRLARQLGFYDDLLRLLARHEIVRPPHQTPMEFSRSLLFLPGGAYETVRRLTGLFYRVRYGHAELTPGQQGRLRTVLGRLEGELTGSRLGH